MRETREWRLGEGQVGLEGWISFLWGTDLQSRSGTGTPFNQRYSNCIGWPLQRVSLGDFTWLTRLQDFEDIMGSRHDSVGVWEPRAIRVGFSPSFSCVHKNNHFCSLPYCKLYTVERHEKQGNFLRVKSNTITPQNQPHIYSSKEEWNKEKKGK